MIRDTHTHNKKRKKKKNTKEPNKQIFCSLLICFFHMLKSNFLLFGFLIAERTTIREAIKIVVRMNLLNIIVEKDCHVTLYSIIDRISVQKQVSIWLQILNILFRKDFMSINFCYYNRTVNILTDNVMKKAHNMDYRNVPL